MQKSDYIIYVDESGDHGIENIDRDYPIFVLSFCLFTIEEYIQIAVPDLQRFKFEYFGHDQVILHEHDIRKQGGNFKFLRSNRGLREDFLAELSELVVRIPFDIISIVIDKQKLKKRYTEVFNPYHLSLRLGLERLLEYLLRNGQENKQVHVIFENRGKKEDNELELEFRRICDNDDHFGHRTCDFTRIGFHSFFVDKRSNSCGLQIADVTARPIGLNYLRPNQINRAYKIIESKIYSNKQFP